MLSTVLLISSGEIFIILLFILIFFGADKIPEFTRMMGKGVREFRKATDDIKREFDVNASSVMNDFKTIQKDLTESLTKEIAEPVQETVQETERAFDAYQEQYGFDFQDHYDKETSYAPNDEARSSTNSSSKESDSDSQPLPQKEEARNYYDYQDEIGDYGNEYSNETKTA